jgi:putative ABC transport system permease protein
VTRGGSGGLPARRAVVRWAWRLFLREWRQQVLVLALLAVAVAAAALGVSAGYHVTPLQEARFGSASQLITYYRSDPRGLDARIADARNWFGTVDVIGHRYVPRPGSVETVELREQDTHGPYSAPMLRLLAGHYPAVAGKVAITDELASGRPSGTCASCCWPTVPWWARSPRWWAPPPGWCCGSPWRPRSRRLRRTASTGSTCRGGNSPRQCC